MTGPSDSARDRAARFGLPALGPGAACRALITRLDRLEASTPALWGTMSAGAMVCHLSDAFRVMYGERALASSDRVDARRRLRRTVIKWIALYAPAHWPQGLRTVAAVDRDRDGTRPSDFDHDRADLVGLIERVAAGELPTDGEHPYLGRLSAWEWRRWAYLHVDHHLRQFGH
jgi:hypothetical protein